MHTSESFLEIDLQIVTVRVETARTLCFEHAVNGRVTTKLALESTLADSKQFLEVRAEVDEYHSFYKFKERVSESDDPLVVRVVFVAFLVDGNEVHMLP